jgi:NAD+ kinase
VASHSLNARPITLRDDVELTLSIASRSGSFLTAIDGRSESCQDDTILTLRRATHNIKVVQRKDHSFYSTLREKLMWGTDPRE